MRERKRMQIAIAAGGRAEMRARGFDVDLPEIGADSLPRGTIIIGMRTRAPGKVVPGTRAGYPCARCAEDVRLAPSGQRIAAAGAPVWCVECHAEHEGASDA